MHTKRYKISDLARNSYTKNAYFSTVLNKNKTKTKLIRNEVTKPNKVVTVVILSQTNEENLHLHNRRDAYHRKKRKTSTKHY